MLASPVIVNVAEYLFQVPLVSIKVIGTAAVASILPVAIPTVSRNRNIALLAVPSVQKLSVHTEPM